MAPFKAGAHWMRSLHCGRDDRVFGCGDRVFAQGDLATCHYFVILRERSEPKDLLECGTIQSQCILNEIPPLRSG